MQPSELMISLGVLFAGFQAGKPIDPKIAEELTRPLLALPDAAVNAAIWNFRNAKVEGMSLTYPPSIPAIVAEARRIADHNERIERASSPVKALPAPKNALPEAERKEMGRKMVELAEALSARLENDQRQQVSARRALLITATDRLLAQDERPLAERLRLDKLGLVA
jgi:hypothetical protein